MRVNPILLNRPELRSLYKNPKLEGPKIETKAPEIDQPISREELGALALDLIHGGIDQKEAASKFVGSVTSSLKGGLGEKDYQQLVDDITNFLMNDQQFAKDLTKNLTLFS